MSDFTKKIEELANQFKDGDNLIYLAGAQKALEILASGGEFRKITAHRLFHDKFTEVDGVPHLNAGESIEYIQIEALASIAAKLELANAEITALKAVIGTVINTTGEDDSDDKIYKICSETLNKYKSSNEQGQI